MHTPAAPRSSAGRCSCEAAGAGLHAAADVPLRSGVGCGVLGLLALLLLASMLRLVPQPAPLCVLPPPHAPLSGTPLRVLPVPAPAKSPPALVMALPPQALLVAAAAPACSPADLLAGNTSSSKALAT